MIQRRCNRLTCSPPILAVLLLLVMFAQTALSGPRISVTYDEPFHMSRGYAYVWGEDLRLQIVHPVFIDGLSGLMLGLMPDLTPPEQIEGWETGNLFLFSDHLLRDPDHDVDKMMFLARFPIMCLALLLGAVVYRWAADLYGVSGGLLALTLCVLNPNLIAHARIVSTDLGAACTATLTLFLWWRWSQRPTVGRLSLTAIALGLAISAKTSNLLLVVLVGLFTVLYGLRKHWAWHKIAAAISGVGMGALLILWALYRFEFRPLPSLTGNIPVPAASYWELVTWLRGTMEVGRSAFLWGKYTTTGWWYYFPFALLIKTPIPILIAIGLALYVQLARLHKPTAADYAVCTFPLLYLVVAASSSMNLGYRHVLPVLPFLAVYAARIVTWSGFWTKWGRLALAGSSVWLAASAYSTFPFYLTYFNELVGGPSNGHQYLADSNIDWGQGLKELHATLENLDIDQVQMAYFGTAPIGYYEIPHSSLISHDTLSVVGPQPGWYVISVTYLQGLYLENPDALDWFRRLQPIETPGYSLFVYHIKPDPVPETWVGLCYAPEEVLKPKEIPEFFGQENLRTVSFDCAQAWVEPAGEQAGWYVIPDTGLQANSFMRRMLTQAEIVYQDRGLRLHSDETGIHYNRSAPAYNIYHWDRGSDPDEFALDNVIWSSPALAPGEMDPVTSLSAPVNLGDELEFLGYQISAADVKPGGEVEVTTVWRVLSRPDDPALSFFAHLVGTAGAVSVGDGLGYSAIQWLPGDVFAQQSELVIPADTPPGRYWIQVGIYSLATGDRLQVLDNGQTVTDRVLLTSIEVQP